MGDHQYHVQPLTNPGLVTFEAWDAVRAGSIYAHLKAEPSFIKHDVPLRILEV